MFVSDNEKMGDHVPCRRHGVTIWSAGRLSPKTWMQVVLVGDATVGKTHLLSRYVKSRLPKARWESFTEGWRELEIHRESHRFIQYYGESASESIGNSWKFMENHPNILSSSILNLRRPN